jgi:hypothetical protein
LVVASVLVILFLKSDDPPPPMKTSIPEQLSLSPQTLIAHVSDLSTIPSPPLAASALDAGQVYGVSLNADALCIDTTRTNSVRGRDAQHLEIAYGQAPATDIGASCGGIAVELGNEFAMASRPSATAQATSESICKMHMYMDEHGRIISQHATCADLENKIILQL